VLGRGGHRGGAAARLVAVKLFFISFIFGASARTRVTAGVRGSRGRNGLLYSRQAQRIAWPMLSGPGSGIKIKIMGKKKVNEPEEGVRLLQVGFLARWPHGATQCYVSLCAYGLLMMTAPTGVSASPVKRRLKKQSKAVQLIS
jgi:hypothetical protein